MRIIKEVLCVTNDALREIKKAEDNGAQLIINAKTEAKYRIEQTVREIEKSKLDAEERFKIIYNDRIEVATRQANELAENRLRVARGEAQELITHAEQGMDEAVNIIIEEIKSLWQ